MITKFKISQKVSLPNSKTGTIYAIIITKKDVFYKIQFKNFLGIKSYKIIQEIKLK